MAIEIPKVSYTGKVRKIKLGKGDKAIEVGAADAYPFHTFEGELPVKPKLALEIQDVAPDDWPQALMDVYGDVVNDPAAWAKKALEYEPDAILLHLVGTDPNDKDLPPEAAVDAVKKVKDAIGDVTLIIWGCDNAKKDEEVLRKIEEAFEGERLVIGPVVEDNYKVLGAGALSFNHTAIASTPIDINLAKQLNILLGNLGVTDENIIMDPTVGGLGYGLEYSYSVIERARIAGLLQEDDKLRFPMICYVGKEVWKTKEAKLSKDEAPELGDPVKRGVLIESVTAALLLLAGGDLIVLRHPESLKMVRSYIDQLYGEG